MIPNNTDVIVYNLGDGNEYQGVVKGVHGFSSENKNEPITYLVELKDRLVGHEYSVVGFPNGCVKIKIKFKDENIKFGDDNEN